MFNGLSRRSFQWLGAACLCCALSALAQPYPNKPIRFVVGYPPGGSGDFVTRTVGEAIAAELGQSAVIDNRPGAAGNLASEIVLKAPADGYTLLVGSNPYINKALYKKLPYDIEKDFQPVTLLANGPMVIAVNNSLPVHSIRELIAYAKKNPGKLNFASSGNGSAPHMAGVLFNSVSDLDILHIPFKGGAPAVQSVIAGDTQVIYGTSPVVLPQVRGGRIRALAITTQEKSGAIPGIMGMKEAALPDYDISFSFGLYAPSAMRAEDIKKVFDAAVKVLKRPDIRDKLATQGMDPAPNASPAEFQAQNLKDAPMWAKLVVDSGAKVD
ncbi:Bug family tripartite tricarboxylate transporter substrate binding protein [Limnohabitans sp.]|uniref:Bug family tripartite tricarboxylate transporter substrate binding protein n=1 Tax=Limnohabitans sp. TaxID=1907725 RepID=UPI0038B99AF8